MMCEVCSADAVNGNILGQDASQAILVEIDMGKLLITDIAIKVVSPMIIAP